MNYTPSDKIDPKEYEYIVSLGNKCPTTDTLRKLGIYKESFPFDYIPTTPTLILKYLKDQTDFYPEKGIVRTKDNVWFGHFNINEGYDETIQTFKRRFERLFELLNNKKKILFVYSSEADVYNEMGNRYNDNYGALCDIRNYIMKEYMYDNFMIVAIHVNKTFTNTSHIMNYTINVPDKYLSDDMSTHVASIYSLYRDCLESLMLDIFINQ